MSEIRNEDRQWRGCDGNKRTKRSIELEFTDTKRITYGSMRRSAVVSGERAVAERP